MGSHTQHRYFVCLSVCFVFWEYIKLWIGENYCLYLLSLCQAITPLNVEKNIQKYCVGVLILKVTKFTNVTTHSYVPLIRMEVYLVVLSVLSPKFFVKENCGISCIWCLEAEH